MSIKYAYIHPYSREYLYTDSRVELQTKIAEFAAQVYTEHYCNGALFTCVETLEDGSEKWYLPTGKQVLSPIEIQEEIKKNKSFTITGEIPVVILGK